MGFAAEIKEFLGAAKDSWKLMDDSEYKRSQTKYTDVKTAAEQKEMDDPLNQKLKEAKLAGALATNAQIGKERPLNALDQYTLDLMKKAAARGEPVVGAIPGTGASVVSKPASGTGSPITPPPSYGPDHGPLPQLGLMRKGGLVRKFAEGGVVEYEDLEDEGALPPQAIPTAGTGLPVSFNQKPGMLTPPAQPQRRAAPGPAIGAAAIDPAAGRDVGDPAVGPPLPPAMRAVADALKYGISQAPPALGAIGAGGSSRSRSAALRALAMGAGAAPGSDMLAIFKKIDPEGTMPEGERNLQALQAVHDYKMKAGDPEGAAKTAFQMLQHFKTAQTRYGALAAAAMKGGHVEDGVKLALKQYANIPDGNNLQMWVDKKNGQVNWKLDGPDGKPISGGIATPEEIGSNAAKLATPGGYENYLAQMVSGAKIGGRTAGAGGAKSEEEPPEAIGKSRPKPADYKEIKRQTVDDYVDTWNDSQEANPDGSPAKKLEPKELAATKDMLYHLKRHNDVTENQGLGRIQTILRARDPVEGETPAFRVTENKEEKSRTLLFPDGGELVIPNEQYGLFKSARAEVQAAIAKKEKDEREAAGRPSGLKRFAEGAGNLIDDYAGGLKEGARSVAEKSLGGVENVKQGVRDTVDLLKPIGEAIYKDAWTQRPGALGGEGNGPGGITGGVDVYGGTKRAVSEAQKWLEENPGATP